MSGLAAESQLTQGTQGTQTTPVNQESQDFQVTLDNCDREPIHIPGRIQSHGVLFAFDLAQVLTHRSVNTDPMLGAEAPQLGQAFASTCLGASPEVLEAVQECFDSDGIDLQPVALSTQIAGQNFEVVAHRLGERVIVELECLPPNAELFADHAFKGHRAMNRLKRQRSIDQLLVAAVEEVRTLTGFDRVMAYRFRHDDSGDVVTEARVAELEPFAGRRYPASDIPAQARRLYTINTLRNIADVGSPTVALQALPSEQVPLDMSHCVLRSVSPVHIEYLGNMGVAASMSISVVINGRLWGMLACHHRQAHHVPYSVRSACDVLAQILAAHVQSLSSRLDAERLEAAATVRARAIESVLHADDGIFALMPQAEALCGVLEADALLLSEQSKLAISGGVASAVARQLVQWLDASAGSGRISLVHRHALADLPADLRDALGMWCGFLALRFSETTRGWMVLLRKEQIENIAWGGRPEKEYVHGPLGPRLTPRGSFAVWKETVRGRAVPWSPVDLEIADDLMAELIHARAVRAVELDHARNHLLHILNDGIGLPGESLGATAYSVAAETPSAASNRMQRMVSQVLDASRLQSGAGLALRLGPVDLSQLVKEVTEEIAAAHAGTDFIRELPKTLPFSGDAARLRQLLQGLLGNARLHGAAGESIVVQLHRQGDTVVLDVSNIGDEIGAAVAESMFNPFRRKAGAPTSTRGLGLGLYIARHIVRAHGGDIIYAYADPYVVFTVTLPSPAP